MELLLILSALLSALTGVMGTRAPEVRVQQASVVVQAGVQVAPARRVPLRPAAGLPTLERSAVCAAICGPALAAAIPLYASRRRE